MANLAIKGGKPVFEREMMKPSWPRYSEKSKELLLKALVEKKWGRLFPNSQTEEFEKKFAQYQDARYGVAVFNGTVALQLALRALNVTIGDEIIVPAVTFIATAGSVAETGAIPILADIELETGQISAQSVKEKITPRTKGIIAVHNGGYPIDFDKLLPLIKKHNLSLIEDCAHAHGSEWKGTKVGAIGDIGSFSFQRSKSFSSGEGGIILTNSERLAERAKLIHNIGRVVGKPGYEHYLLSSNYRITEFQSALLLSQMETFPGEVAIRDKNGRFLSASLRKIGGLVPLKEDKRITRRGYYYFVIRYQQEEFGGVSRDKFIEALKAEGVQAGNGYGMPLYKQPAFQRQNIKTILPDRIGPIPDYENMNLPQSEKFCAEQITLDHATLLADKSEIEKLVEAFAKIKKNIKELI